MIEAVFAYIHFVLEVVVYNADDTGQWNISGSFSQSVYSCVNSRDACFDGREGVGCGQVVVVVSVKIEVQLWITRDHIQAEIIGFLLV